MFKLIFVNLASQWIQMSVALQHFRLVCKVIFILLFQRSCGAESPKILSFPKYPVPHPGISCWDQEADAQSDALHIKWCISSLSAALILFFGGAFVGTKLCSRDSVLVPAGVGSMEAALLQVISLIPFLHWVLRAVLHDVTSNKFSVYQLCRPVSYQ